MATSVRVKQGFGRRPPRLGRLFDTSPLYFVTFCTHLRKPFPARGDVHAAFVAYSERARDLNIAVGRYVIMPDHIHLFVRGSQVFEIRPVGWPSETSFSKSRQVVSSKGATLGGMIFRSRFTKR
jgi:REP element-mobilizing transposase RayT